MRTLSKILPALGMLLLFVFSTGCESNQELETTLSDVATADLVLKDAPVSGTTFYIINRNSGRALDLEVSTGNVLQYSYWGGTNQKWILTDVGSGYYRISPVSDSDLALDIASQSTDDGANLQTYGYWGGYNQQFQLLETDSGYYQIINRNSGKALDVYNAGTANTDNVVQWTYWGGNNQQWMLHSLASQAGSNGQLSWTLTSTGLDSAVEARITAAMDAAVARYNYWADWPSRTLTVEYNTGVATADATLYGHIRFGPGTDYQNERTALHEIAHTWGVGTSSAWASPLIVDYYFVGPNTVAKIEEFDGSGATISTGGGHFWPYGLNYNSEWSETNGDRHVQLVWAMVVDGLY